MRLLSRVYLFLLALATPLLAQQRQRVIIETDARGDPDDEQSLVRFLLYANEWDIEGIIANRPHARAHENLNPERTGLGIVQREIRAYGKVYPHLRENAPGYPTEAYLMAHAVAGYSDTDAISWFRTASSSAPTSACASRRSGGAAGWWRTSTSGTFR